MNKNGNIKIPLVIIIAIVVVIISIVAVIVIVTMPKKVNVQNQIVENQIQNENKIVEEQPTEEDYKKKYEENIASVELPKVEVGTIATQNSTIDGRVPSFYNPVIPKGFRAITSNEDSTIDANAIWGQLNSYLYGLVIEDSNKNQFVWIPVENMDLFKTTDWQKNEARNTIDSTYVEPNKTIQEDYYKMYYKVKKYGGFYVGRYETGDADEQNTRTEVKNSDNIGIRKNLVVYNYVPFKLSTINKREITGANELAKKFAENNSYENVTTTVIYGTQWDSMLRFIKSEKNNVNDSVTWGNYPVSVFNFKDINGNEFIKSNTDVYLIKTGSSEQTKTKNIYDIAGNVAEWTMETTKNNVNIARGGAFNSTIAQLAAARYAYQNNTASSNVGFRISMYVE